MKEIRQLPKSVFSLADLRKVSQLRESSLKTTLSRALKLGEIVRLAGGWYCADLAKVSWENLAVSIYQPSYVSFESALNFYNILSQQSVALTLATVNRAKKLAKHGQLISYRHISPNLFWGYKKEGDFWLAEPEKAWLDLAYLSLNGYGYFSPEEMNLELLDVKKVKAYLRKFNNFRLENIIKATGFV